MLHPIGRAAVPGTGTMGASTAAHLANAGIPVLLLDISSQDDPADRNRAARAGLDRALKARPPAFTSPNLQTIISPGNFEDDLLTGAMTRQDSKIGVMK